MADLERSIPSMVDGLKPGQRKILFCSFKRNFVKEAKVCHLKRVPNFFVCMRYHHCILLNCCFYCPQVAQFIGYVSEHSAYHHGEQSLASTILGMAQDFVGSNNIILLEPRGQFGTRNQVG
jgi:DNA topoisomerase-2